MKKKTSIYFLIPLLCTLGFGGYYWTFLKAHNTKEQDRIAKIEQAKKDKAAKDIRDQEQAYNNALEARKQKDAATAAKKAKETADKEAKMKRKEARTNAENEAERMLSKIDDKKSELEAIDKQIVELEAQKKSLAAEAAIIQKTVLQAKENTAKSQETVLQYQKAAEARRRIEAERLKAEQEKNR